mmetsp:Transcript_6734/g.13222  ORF Transcript_6734/g.13222 Transcript_6734/m.13222 type:complete len:221 (+) Transcript_6734:882-1544(+)
MVGNATTPAFLQSSMWCVHSTVAISTGASRLERMAAALFHTGTSIWHHGHHSTRKLTSAHSCAFTHSSKLSASSMTESLDRVKMSLFATTSWISFIDTCPSGAGIRCSSGNIAASAPSASRGIFSTFFEMSKMRDPRRSSTSTLMWSHVTEGNVMSKLTQNAPAVLDRLSWSSSSIECTGVPWIYDAVSHMKSMAIKMAATMETAPPAAVFCRISTWTLL